MSNLVVREYLGNGIEFKLVDGVVYANANKMASGFGGSKKLENWKASPNTIRYIEALGVNPKFQGTQFMISKKGNSSDFEQGTWIHEKLVLNFARYINIHFELWCDEQIATLLREGEVSINPKQSLLLSIIQSQTEVERAIALNKYELEYVKPLEQNLTKTQEKLKHKQEVVNCLVDEVKLKTQRQFLIEIINMKGVQHIQKRWSALYKVYEQQEHINIKARLEAYNLINKPKLKSQIEYIDVVRQDIPNLYNMAVKLFESDFKNKLKQYHDML